MPATCRLPRAECQASSWQLRLCHQQSPFGVSQGRLPTVTWNRTSIAVSPSASYDLRAYVRGELDAEDSGPSGASGNWEIRAYFYDNNGTYISYDTADSGGGGSLSTTWQQEGGPVTAPANAATMRIQLHSEMGNGWVAFDDVSVSEWQSKSYYFFGAQRVAMRSNGVEDESVLYWLAGDHLGTTSLVLNEAGDTVVAESRHYPYGEERWSSGADEFPTDYRFTGQSE